MIGSEETPLQTTERITTGVCDTFVFALLAVNPREVRFTELPNSHCRIVLELQNDANWLTRASISHTNLSADTTAFRPWRSA